MQQNFDCEKEYGIVLEGGGAKGAYQIGVWGALHEYGIKIKGISGVSVGALNGALICMGDIDVAKSLWEDITYSQVMNVDNNRMDNLIKGNITELSLSDISSIRKDTVKILADGGIDVTPLKNLIKEYVDEDKIRKSNIELIVGTFSITQMKEININVKDIEQGLISDYLLGSAYFPAFKHEKLHGKKYIDGGVVNNVPVDMLINREFKDIIVIRIFGVGLEKKVKIPEDVNVITIAPRVDLGNILEFDPVKSRRNLKIGYFDGLRWIHNLEGKIYYIDGTYSEEFYAVKLCQSTEEAMLGLLELYHKGNVGVSLYLRHLLETVYPLIASELNLEKNWTYKDLYLSMMELCAKNLKIQKYHVYKEDELHLLIRERYYKKIENGTEFIPFVKAILNIIVKI